MVIKNELRFANLVDLLEAIGEDRTKSILSDFSCPLNKDIDDFLHTKAILFEKQGIAATHLVFKEYKGERVLVGYFSLANKLLTVSKKALPSKTLQKKISQICIII